ncbi:hypothetical protein [Streptomyces sp. NPDC008122]|uniref:hypothetical protein n=1 Tax=Streptomyces sp. NPDC008122 TaxID=3364810 RepID=UPI0036E39D91
MQRTTLEWATRNESAQKAAIASLNLRGKALPDAFLTDHWLPAQFLKAYIVEVIKNDAPEGVVEDLLPLYRRMSRGAEEISEYLVHVMGQLEGLRDEHEIAPVLERARDAAPDTSSREKVERALGKLRNPWTITSLVALSDDEFAKLRDDGPCLDCCTGGCIACWPSECVACCVVNCVIC